MASYNNQLGDRDRDLEDWLHLTGWYNTKDRENKLEQFRNIHNEYEAKRQGLMKGTFDATSQNKGHHHHKPSKMEMEMAGGTKVNLKLSHARAHT